MKILSLNMSGWGNTAKRRRLSSLIQSGVFEMCLLQETKRSDFDDFMIQNLWGNYNVDWLTKESTGKRNLWSELLDFKLNNEKGEWVLGGDFNAILKVDERKGCNGGGLRNEREEFGLFVDLVELSDIPVVGKNFSWFSADSKSMSRIDHFLLSEGFIDKGGISGQWIGNHDISDHCPIWLLCSNLDWGPKPFKFNNCWTRHLEFNSFVTNLWRNLNINGKKAFVIKEKLKLLKEGLKV
ncbi:uncharacterized protein LOC123904409 [Trifolium pratense]|uniref:uncharacterized protein LOC123904409 n=1 Tax=Trifolium pratense TaxID=57577 RepID=UPI001E69789B|nr:uncharacterized protein LOC123904409 [Trifolium pratense]